MAQMMRVAFHQSGFCISTTLLDEAARLLLLLFFLQTAVYSRLCLPPNSSSSSALLPGDGSKTPRRALSGAALSGSSALSLSLSISLSRLFVPPRRVSRMLAKTEHLRDERAIHYRPPPTPPPLPGPQRFPVSAPIAPSLRTRGNSLRAERLESGC